MNPIEVVSDEDLFNDLIVEEDSDYYCEICDFTSETSESLLKHIADSHNQPRRVSTTPLEYDENSDHITVKFMCSLCFTSFQSIAEVKTHMMKDHKLKEKQTETPEPPPDPVDNSEFLKLSLKDLKTKLLKNAIYRCTIKGCMFKFETPERRDIHLKCHSSYSNVREFKCFDCSEEQKGWRHCVLHLWKVHHIDVDLLKCPICPFKAKNTVKIFQHLPVHGGDKGFTPPTVTRWYSRKTCQICLNVFANSKTLTKHMKRHNKIVSYRCNICNKGSTNKATWLIHMRQHTGEKPLKCKVCPFNARDPSVMRKHTLRHTAQKPYKCQRCDYSAIQSMSIKVHIRQNHPDLYEKMKCSQCKFISVSQELLERHYNDHKAGLVKSEEETKAPQTRQPDHHLPEVSSDCFFLPMESTDPHDPPLDIGGVTIPAHSEDTQFTMFN